MMICRLKLSINMKFRVILIFRFEKNQAYMVPILILTNLLPFTFRIPLIHKLCTHF